MYARPLGQNAVPPLPARKKRKIEHMKLEAKESSSQEVSTGEHRHPCIVVGLGGHNVGASTYGRCCYLMVETCKSGISFVTRLI